MKRSAARPKAGRPRPAGPAQPPRRPRRSHRGRWLVVALALVAGGGAYLLWIRAAPPAPPDSIRHLQAQAAADTADMLVRSGHHLEALRYLAQVERLALRPTADYEGGLSICFNNASVQAHEVDGMVMPATRSSIERIELLRESMRHLDIGEDKAERSDQKSNIIVARGNQLAVWGFVREGYAEYRRAHQVNPLDGRRLSEAGWLEKMFQDPTVVLPPPGGSGSAAARPAP